MKKKLWFFIGFILLGIIIALTLSQLPPNWFTPDILVNLSSILTLISFSVRSILALRLLAIGAQLTFIPYCLLQSPPLWIPVLWNLLFMGVNVVNVIILLLERRPVKLKPEEEKLYNLAFKSLSRREFLKVLTWGEWKEGKPEEILLDRGEVSTSVMILCSGEAVAILEEKELLTIPEGKLIGVSSQLTGDPLPVTIKLKVPSRYICWSVKPFRKFLETQPEIRTKFQSIVSRDLAQTVQSLPKMFS